MSSKDLTFADLLQGSISKAVRGEIFEFDAETRKYTVEVAEYLLDLSPDQGYWGTFDEICYNRGYTRKIWIDKLSKKELGKWVMDNSRDFFRGLDILEDLNIKDFAQVGEMEDVTKDVLNALEYDKWLNYYRVETLTFVAWIWLRGWFRDLNLSEKDNGVLTKADFDAMTYFIKQEAKGFDMFHDDLLEFRNGVYDNFIERCERKGIIKSKGISEEQEETSQWVVKYNDTVPQMKIDYSGTVVTPEVLETLRELDRKISRAREFGNPVEYLTFYFEQMYNNEFHDALRINVGDGTDRTEKQLLFLEEN